MDALTAAIIALEENPPPKGDRGERGPTGDRGPVGPRGPQGPKGEEGEEGSVGRDGQDGEPGPRGDKGNPGEDGQSVERAEAYGLPPDRPPVAVFDNGLLRLGIPRGKRGPPGPAGYGGGGSGSVHPNLTAHSAIGLATDTALAAHAAGPHGGAYRDAVLADSPVAYWRLGEALGNPQDSAGTNHVTVVGGTPTYGVTGALSGDSDTAVTLDGSTEYFSVPDAVALDLGDILSIELWFKRTSAADTAERNLVSKGQNAYALTFNVSADHAIAFVKDNVSVIVRETGTTEDTNWHHVVVTKNGAAVKLYKDGADVTGSVTNATLANTTDALNIGRDIAAGSLFWAGSIDEVALYNTVLTPARVLAHYAASGRLTAEDVSVSPAVAGASDVQAALEAAEDRLVPAQWTFPDATGRVLMNLDSSGGSAQDGIAIVADELPSDTVDLFTIRVPAVLPDTGEYQVFNVASDGSVEHKLANDQSTAVLIDDVLTAAGGSFYLLQVVGRTSRPGKFVAQMGEGSDPVSKGFKVGGGGFIIAKHNAAPADADLTAGDVALWLDQTNGAAKLKIKGKSANGTVVTGEVALT